MSVTTNPWLHARGQTAGRELVAWNRIFTECGHGHGETTRRDLREFWRETQQTDGSHRLSAAKNRVLPTTSLRRHLITRFMLASKNVRRAGQLANIKAVIRRRYRLRGAVHRYAGNCPATLRPAAAWPGQRFACHTLSYRPAHPCRLRRGGRVHKVCFNTRSGHTARETRAGRFVVCRPIVAATTAIFARCHTTLLAKKKASPSRVHVAARKTC